MRLAADLLFAAMLASAGVTDLRSRRIPNRLLAAAVVLGLPLLGLEDPGSVPGRLGVAVLAGGAFLAVSLARPGGLGMGDVKLIAVMGLFLDRALAGAVLVALCAGAAVGLALFVRDGRAAAKATIPFGPFLALGGLLALLGALPTLQ